MGLTGIADPCIVMDRPPLEEGMRNLTFVFRMRLAILCAGAMLCGHELRAQTQTQTPPRSLPPTTISLQNDALAGVRYDNRWQFYFGAGYRHFNAGPGLLQGANLGGPDMQITRRMSSHWGATGNVRGYWGTSGAVPNQWGIQGPLVSEYLFLAGPEYRGPRNEHAAVNFHALAGGAYGIYDSDLKGHPPGAVGFYNNGLVFGSAFGGSLDLNRSANWALRISPDVMVTHHGGQYQEQFALSVGVLYRFTGRKHAKPAPTPNP
jgi:hypothetical protein